MPPGCRSLELPKSKPDFEDGTNGMIWIEGKLYSFNVETVGGIFLWGRHYYFKDIFEVLTIEKEEELDAKRRAKRADNPSADPRVKNPSEAAAASSDDPPVKKVKRTD